MSSSEADGPVQSPQSAWMQRLRGEALRMRRPEVSNCIHIGWIIASYADPDGTNSFCSGETIAAIAGCSEETVSRCTKVLVAVGVLEKKRRPNQSSMYRLVPVIGRRPPWEAHLHLYKETRQARRKRALKEKEIAEYLAARAAEEAAKTDSDAERFPDTDAERGPSTSETVPGRGPEPVPAGGSGTSGTRRGTVLEPDAERVPEPVPAGGVPVPPTFGRDHHPDQNSDAVVPQLPDAHANEGQTAESTGHAQGLHGLPSTPGRSRTPVTSMASQPPLLFAVPGIDLDTLRATATPEDVRQALLEYGRIEALRLFGSALVLPVLASLDTSATPAPPSPEKTEPSGPLSVRCGFCNASPGSPCRTRRGTRQEIHGARHTAWAMAHADCPDCQAPAHTPCLGAEGRPLADAHDRRLQTAQQAHAQTTTSETGT